MIEQTTAKKFNKSSCLANRRVIFNLTSPKCGLCKRVIKDWQWFTYVHDGMVTTICKDCIREYEKILGWGK